MGTALYHAFDTSVSSSHGNLGLLRCLGLDQRSHQASEGRLGGSRVLP